MATYVIGDIHGCYKTLKALRKEINYIPSQDTLWFTGDLVNRGPQSLDVLKCVMDTPKHKMVLGNHDLYLLYLADNPNRLDRYPSLAKLLEQKDIDTYIQWLKQQPLMHHDPNFDVFMVHAGIPTIWTPEKAHTLSKEVTQYLKTEKQIHPELVGNEPHAWQDNLSGIERLRTIINYLTRMRFVDKDCRLNLDQAGPLGSQPSTLIPWFNLQPHTGPTILFGHWASLQGKIDHPRIQALDGGCVWKGSLIALRLEDKKRFDVPYQG